MQENEVKENVNLERTKGTIKWFGTKSYGYIRSEGLGEIFFHLNDICTQFKPTQGQKVSYLIGKDKLNRIKAIDVKLEE